MERLGIIVTAEGTLETSNGIKLVSTSTKDLAKELDTLNGAANASAQAQKVLADANTSNAAATTNNAQAVQTLGRELANGNLKGAAVQAGQLALSSEMMTVGLLGAGAAALGLVAGLGLLAVAASQGSKEEQALNDALLLTGNYAGLVAGQMDSMASSIARNIGGKVSDSRSVLAGLVSTGKFTVESLNEVSAAAQLVARFSGQTNEQVVKNFASMADGAANWAAKTNESYHFLSFAQYKYIELLEQQGQKQEAYRVASEALNAHVGGSLTANLGTLARTWKEVGNWADKAWASMMNVGKAETTQDKLESVNARLAYLGSQRMAKGGQERQAQLVATLQANRQAYEAEIAQDKEFAENRSKQEQRAAEQIAKDREKTKKTGGRVAVDREPELQRRLIAENAGLSPSFAGDWDRLTEVYKKNGLTLEWLTDAQGKLLAKQPAMRAAAQEQAALARTEAQYQESLVRIMDQYLNSLERGNDALEKTNKGLREHTEQLGLTKEQIGYLKAARIDDTIAQEKANLATAEGSNADERKLTLMREHIKLLQEERGLQAGLTAKTVIVDAEKAQADASKKFGEDIRKDFRAGLIRGIEDGKTPLKALGDTLGAIVKERLLSAFADSILNGFEPLIKQVMGRIQVPSGGGGGGGLGGALSGLAQAIFGGGWGAAGVQASGAVTAPVHGGSAVGVALPPLKFAKGGAFTNSVVDSPTLFKFAKGTGLMGEAGPEAIMPLKRGADGALGVAVSGGGGGAPVINIYTPPGTKAETKTRKGADGGFNVDVMISAVEDALADRVSSGSGTLYGAMGDRFGLRTQVG